MYERLDMVRLKSGEEVELGVVIGPDLDWADRIDEDLLGHKGPTWRWGNRLVLTEAMDLEAYFYILHRDGVPFASVMNIEYQGIGILGHVFTKPEDRRQSAHDGTVESSLSEVEIHVQDRVEGSARHIHERDIHRTQARHCGEGHVVEVYAETEVDQDGSPELQRDEFDVDGIRLSRSTNDRVL